MRTSLEVKFRSEPPSRSEAARLEVREAMELMGAPQRNLSAGQESRWRKLDSLSQQAGFWCSLVAKVQPGRAITHVCADVRETVLEELFDVTPERVAEVFSGMVTGAGSASPTRRDRGRVLQEELAQGLARFGLVGFDDEALSQVFEIMSIDGKLGLSLADFDAILSRMKLAQLLIRRGGGDAALPTPASPLRVIAVDYNTQEHSRADYKDSNLRDFFFRNRTHAQGTEPLVRWVHLCNFDMTSLLALTVKYSLHPLGVEDVIEQCPTKIDRYGSHFFVAVEQLSLDGPATPDQPVRVASFHLSLFCCGPPLYDTIITVFQPDRSFARDWPGGSVTMQDSPAGDALAEKLRRRLLAPRSRLRERRADFLMYHAVDLCVDALSGVTHAYATRLQRLEGLVDSEPAVNMAGKAPVNDFSGEAALMRMQMQVVMRRIRGLQRMVRQLIGDGDLASGLARYLQDALDHLDEAYEDALHLADRSGALVAAHRRAVERCLEDIRQRSSDRLSTMLFVLTIGTFIFAPMQFLAGVYGMNFVYEEKPTIPELGWRNGYVVFWGVIAIYLVVLAMLSTGCYWRWKRSKAEDKVMQKRMEGMTVL